MKHILQFLEPKIMSLVCYQQPSGKIAILTPVIAPGVTLEFIIKRSIPDGTPYKIVGDDFNIDGEYFEAYDFCPENAAKINIDRAKAMHLDKLRVAREPKLAALDIAFMRAVEQADTTKQSIIAKQKQALRDITKINLPNDLSGIKATWPEILN